MQNVYASFDVFPSAKGSSTHINEMLSELRNHAEELTLLCLRGKESLPSIQKEGNVLIKRYYSEEKLNYLEKASLFSEQIYLEIERNSSDIKIGHFRDIWSGMGILAHKNIKSVFEVNALTSIELPYRYPNLSANFLAKLKELESQCLNNSDVIITPSATTKKFLITNYKIAEEKIKVIQNGAHIPKSFTKPADAPENYLIYFGAIQSWQGLDVLLKAISYLLDYEDLKLVICLSVNEKEFKPYLKLIEKLGISERIIIKSQLKKDDLYNYIHFAKISIAPLKSCDRNITQGCSPLKILESMACKTAIISSEIPVVNELLTENEALFFEADREMDLARCIRFLLDSPEKREELAAKAYAKFEQEFTWQIQLSKLNLIYKNLRND